MCFTNNVLVGCLRIILEQVYAASSLGLSVLVYSYQIVWFCVEFKYHLLFTDYLDDVSREGYPTYNALYQKDPALPGLTYRGDELPGGGIFPYTNAMPNRGNPKNNDAYYNTLVRLAVSLN